MVSTTGPLQWLSQDSLITHVKISPLKAKHMAVFSVALPAGMICNPNVTVSKKRKKKKMVFDAMINNLS